ncbi:MAG: thioredoxin-like domain-containing protein [bacterium]|nr:thioredoxin-like domain-containing protein [bacterium]
MLRLIVLLFIFLGYNSYSQRDSLLIKPGSKAPSFIMNIGENSIQSFNMPYMNRIVLLHFWNSDIVKARTYNKNLDHLAEHYKNSLYRNAESFEIIAVAVQTDKNAWHDAIVSDSLSNFTHGIAVRGYNDEVCRKYGISKIPTEILIDEKGSVVLVNPRIMDIENYLDERKNIQPLRKDVVGRLAQSSDREEPIKFCRLFLLNYYGDSIQKTVTTQKGEFIFENVKLNQDLVLKIDNKVDINTSDPIALYSPRGEFLMDGRTRSKGFVFYIPARSNHKLTESDSDSDTNYLGQIDVIKHLTFFTNGKGLTPKDEEELNPIVTMLQKNKALKIELTTHTDARMDAEFAGELTAYQAQSIKLFFEKKGISSTRIKAVGKGNSELRKICEGVTDCSEEDHMINRRVEFLIYKD